jgi:CTD kinase subunit gamma
MNNRANIMYFIEHLCDMATKENHLPFVNMIQRDIIRVVDAAAPSDGSGAANVKHVRRVLNGLQSKSILSTETVAEIDASLKERERYSEDLLDFKAPAGDELQSDESKGDILRTASASKIKVDKRQIEQRIEEDRERNKRLREIIWAVPSNDAGELDAMWDDVSDIGEDDYLQTAEETQERARAAEAVVMLD